MPSTGSAINDFLIWSWGWELDACLNAGYSNQVVQAGKTFPPLPNSAISTKGACDWISYLGWPPYERPRNAGGAAAQFVHLGQTYGDPWYFDPGGLNFVDDNGYTPWNASFNIIPNYDSTRDFVFEGAWPTFGAPSYVGGLAGSGIAHVMDTTICIPPGGFEDSFNADFGDLDPPQPGRTYGAGSKCLLIAGAGESTHGDTSTGFMEVPILFTPKIGCYNQAVSASATDGAARHIGPMKGWLQFSYKSVSNQYQFDPPNPSLASQTKFDGAGGDSNNPIITFWNGYKGLPGAQVLLGLFPVTTATEAEGGPGVGGTRDVMLSILPSFTNGIGPASSGATFLGPTFALPTDRDWHRIAIKFNFDKTGGLAGTVQASVWLDGAELIGDTTITLAIFEAWVDWERLGFSAGTAVKLLDQSLYTEPPNPGTHYLHYSCFGMFDHIFLWGDPSVDGTKMLYIDALKPDQDAQTSIAAAGFPADPTGNGWGTFIGAGTPGPNYIAVDTQNNPDIWATTNPMFGPMLHYGSLDPIAWSPIDYPPGTIVPAFTNALIYGDTTLGGTPPASVLNPQNSAYAFSLTKTTDIQADWFPKKIYGVQQISIHSYTGESRDYSSVYTTMSVGPVGAPAIPPLTPDYVTSWPQGELMRPVPSPDKALADEHIEQNIIYIFSSASVDGNNTWTYDELNRGTGSIFVEID